MSSPSYCIEILRNGAWYPYDNRRFTTRAGANAALEVLAAARPHDRFAILGIF